MLLLFSQIAYADILAKGVIISPFDGYKLNNIYRFSDGSEWQQIDGWFWVWSWVHPEAIVYDNGGGTMLHVDPIDNDVHVIRIK